MPGRLSVVGVDDIPFARFGTPPLTTVHVPQEELGVRAWQQLFSVMQRNGEVRMPRPAASGGSKGRLEVRNSTGRAPA